MYLNEFNFTENVLENLNLNLSIADLFFFDDYFYPIIQDFSFFDNLNNKVFNLGDYYVKIIINKYDGIFFPKY